MSKALSLAKIEFARTSGLPDYLGALIVGCSENSYARARRGHTYAAVPVKPDRAPRCHRGDWGDLDH